MCASVSGPNKYLITLVVLKYPVSNLLPRLNVHVFSKNVSSLDFKLFIIVFPISR